MLKFTAISFVLLNASESVDHQKPIRALDSQPLLKFTRTPNDSNVTFGEKFVLSCGANGAPLPSIYWELNGMRIQGEETSNVYENILNDGKQVSNAAMVSSHYRIPCATARNSGAYKCIIDNGLTKLEHVAKVFVGGNKTNCALNDNGAPFISMTVDFRLEISNNAVALSCRSETATEWSWHKGEQLLTNDGERYQMFPSGDLIIRNISWSDMGEYNCTARNHFGETTAITFLYPTLAK